MYPSNKIKKSFTNQSIHSSLQTEKNVCEEIIDIDTQIINEKLIKFLKDNFITYEYQTIKISHGTFNSLLANKKKFSDMKGILYTNMRQAYQRINILLNDLNEKNKLLKYKNSIIKNFGDEDINTQKINEEVIQFLKENQVTKKFFFQYSTINTTEGKLNFLLTNKFLK
jgi:hypothetical protein